MSVYKCFSVTLLVFFIVSQAQAEDELLSRERRQAGCTPCLQQQTTTILNRLDEIENKLIRSDGYDGYKYFLSPNIMNWQAARDFCLWKGADLAQYGMRNEATKLKIAYAVIQDPNARVWIGLRKTGSGPYTWIDGTVATSSQTSWGPTQPNGNGNCANLWNRNYRRSGRGFPYTMDDDSCANARFFALCEKRITYC